jgi:hypothetical protein
MNSLIQLLLCSLLGWGGGGFDVGDTRGEYCTQGERVVFVIWADACNGGSGSHGPGEQSGNLHAKDGREIAWECNTTDGRTGKAKIDGVEYDLAKGCVFLVSTQNKQTTVQQCAKDVAGIASGPQAFRGVDDALSKLAKDDDQIAKFVKAGEGK